MVDVSDKEVCVPIYDNVECVAMCSCDYVNGEESGQRNLL